MKPFFSFNIIDNFILVNVPFIAVFFYFLAKKLFLTVIKVSIKRNIVLELNERSAHTSWCTNLGGIIIYFGLVLSLGFFGSLYQREDDFRNILAFIGAATILFFIGLKDDLIMISIWKKIIGQLIAFSILIFISGTRIESLNGIFGVYELSLTSSILFSFLALFFIINSFNLADGIDGLAGSIALLANIIFGFYFYFHNELNQSVLAFTLVGILFSFLHFNFSDRFKVIMGDSGSMVVGVSLAYHFFNFLSFNNTVISSPTINASFLYLVALFSYPIVDTTRIFFIRLVNGRSPFSADRNHIHHALLDKGLKHVQITRLILFITLVLLTLAYFLSDFDINFSLTLLIVMAYALYLITAFLQFPAIVFFSNQPKNN